MESIRKIGSLKILSGQKIADKKNLPHLEDHERKRSLTGNDLFLRRASAQCERDI